MAAREELAALPGRQAPEAAQEVWEVQAPEVQAPEARAFQADRLAALPRERTLPIWPQS